MHAHSRTGWAVRYGNTRGAAAGRYNARGMTEWTSDIWLLGAHRLGRLALHEARSSRNSTTNSNIQSYTAVYRNVQRHTGTYRQV